MKLTTTLCCSLCPRTEEATLEIPNLEALYSRNVKVDYQVPGWSEVGTKMLCPRCSSSVPLSEVLSVEEHVQGFTRLVQTHETPLQDRDYYGTLHVNLLVLARELERRFGFGGGTARNLEANVY